MITQAVEDGCRMSHDDIVRTLLSRLARLADRDPALYADALFWAAESGRSEILADLLNLFQQDRRQIIRALAGAVSGNRFSSIMYLLDSAGVDTIDQVAPKRFADAVRMIMPEAFARTLGGCAEPLSRLAENALQASRSGDLGKVIESFELAKAQHSGNNMRGFSGAFSEAVKSGHSDILLYLCENREPHLVSPCVTSAAIAQIFMNFGWDVNEPDISSKFGANGVQNGQLLHFAVQRKTEDVLEVIELLLNRGCPINSLMFEDDPRSWMQWKLGESGTPLFMAVQQGKTEVVNFLLLNGVHPTITSTTGRTPLEVAEAAGHMDIAQLFKQN